jgi:hypothetical protein
MISVSEVLVPGQPNGLTIAVYRPATAGQQTPSAPAGTVKIDDAKAIGQLTDLLNRLTPRGLPPPALHLPSTGAHDLLHFTYPDGARRTIKVTRDGYRSVSVAGLPGSWSPMTPLYATIDMLLPATLREELDNPVGYPPSEHPQYISEEEAIAIALCGASRPLPAAHARLMTRDETGRFDPSLGANNASPHPARKVWLVSIHGEVQTRGSLVSSPSTVHGYSVVIDAETEMVTDVGHGTAPLGKESCIQCQS